MRAVAGLPLGSTTCPQPTAMINIIGQHPDPAAILAEPDAHLHFYGKGEREGRKLGHITLRASSHHELQARLQKIAPLLPNPMSLPIER